MDCHCLKWITESHSYYFKIKLTFIAGITENTINISTANILYIIFFSKVYKIMVILFNKDYLFTMMSYKKDRNSID